MRHDIIREMISDPEFNPEAWLEAAIIQYIDHNFTNMISDKVALPYLIKGMEGYELENLASQIATKADISIIKQLCDGLNDKAAREDAEKIGSAVRSIISKTIFPTQRSDADQILNLIVDIKKVDTDPKNILLKMTNIQIGAMLRNWRPIWTPVVWQTIFDKVDGQILSNILKNKCFNEAICKVPREFHNLKKKCRQLTINWPAEIQTILIGIIAKIDENSLLELIEWVTKFRFTSLYNREDYHYLAKKCADPNEVVLNDKICRCGFAASSGSGITLHLIKARNYKPTQWSGTPKCCNLQVMTALRLRLARSSQYKHLAGPICIKCGERNTYSHEQQCSKYLEIA